ncbi:MAG: mannose-6-phosphate isomerase [Phyllobacteriaceae bacterium]|nr:mannose-6-phosphate isomerase [Phyllobacteriaceae bacterium]
MIRDDVAARGQEIAARARHWLDERALPLWSDAGFDAANGVFHERLDFAGRPAEDAPRRLMVQARQISVFARAALEDGFALGRDLAVTAAENMIDRWLAADGAPGWVFSVDPDGAVVDPCRDLYAHAFVLYGLAWAHRLDPSDRIVAAVDDTLVFLDTAFADPIAGGWWDHLPVGGPRRSQNPHMHLFEALLELHEAGLGDDAVLDRCRALDALAATRFLAADRSVLREDFAADWTVAPSEGEGRVEPGHLLEWAWLLRRFETATGEDRGDRVAPLIRTALDKGIDRATGRIVDEIGEDGRLLRASSRSWPHAEACKALATEILRGRGELAGDLVAVAARLLEAHCRTEFHGGWIDHLDAEDAPMSPAMPASTLYHVYGGLKAVESVFAPRG